MSDKFTKFRATIVVEDFYGGNLSLDQVKEILADVLHDEADMDLIEVQSVEILSEAK